MIRKIIPLLLLSSALFFSCEDSNIYYHSEVIPLSGWDRNQTLYFQDSLRAKAPEKLHFEIDLRHTNLYPYQNLWLYIRTKCSDGTSRLDSINWTLSEPNGRWIGSGWGSLYSLSHRLPDILIKKNTGSRWFIIEIQHGLRNKTLTGIEDIGVRLFTDPKK
jgi:gliding motility-associated lipoprotein GldH